MTKKFLLMLLLVCIATVARASDPTDLVPRGSGLYDAVAVLAQKHLLADNAPDVTDLLAATGRLYTRGELARFVQSVETEPTDPEARAAYLFARNILSSELEHGQDTTPAPEVSHKSSLAMTGFAEPEYGGRSDQGALHAYGELYGRGRLLGSLGRDGAFTLSATNIYRQTRDHASSTTKNNGHGGADNPDVLDGIDEAYVTTQGRHGLRATLGYLRQRWGSGYQGDLMVSDNGPPHPTLEIEFPFSLGHTLGDYRFTQYESIYQNLATTVYQGGRRIEHPIGDRVGLSIEETYNSNNFGRPIVLVLPYYAYQQFYYTHQSEPANYNYNFNLGVTIRPEGPEGLSRAYGQFFIDDIQAPKGIGQGNKIPRKIGYLLGLARTFPQTGTDAVIEYAYTDRETYAKPLDYEAPLAWFNGDLPQGYPIGPNGKELFLRLGQRLGSRLDFSLEARDRKRARDNFPAPTDRGLDLGLAYHLSSSRSLGLRFSQYHEDPFTGVSTNGDTGLPNTPSIGGGADYGQTLRRRSIAVTFIQAF